MPKMSAGLEIYGETHYSVEETANLLGVSRTAIYTRLQRGNVPGAFHFVGRWFIPQTYVKAALIKEPRPTPRAPVLHYGRAEDRYAECSVSVARRTTEAEHVTCGNCLKMLPRLRREGSA